LLGYLDPEYFLGGRLRLDRGAAEQALTPVARRLGLSLAEAAWGVHHVVNESMAAAARVHVVERGRDARTLPVLAFGGAGPVHGDRVARLLHAPELVAPAGAGVTSALGFLAAPLAFEFVRSYHDRIEEIDWTAVNSLLRAMEADGRAMLRAAGVAEDAIAVHRTAELRYVGQGHEIRVPLPAGALTSASVTAILTAFNVTYAHSYGRPGPAVPVEGVHWRVRTAGPRPRWPGAHNRPRGSVRLQVKAHRPAYFPECGGFEITPVYDRYTLLPESEFSGPAIVEERESTLVVGPHALARLDPYGNVVVRWNNED
jgi:N-methylhydantoinase A